jgi:DNA-binding LytR/AlgR family response regulator
MLYTTAKNDGLYNHEGPEEQLPAENFIKVHKSFIVNIGKIKALKGNILHVGNEKIAISQNLREKVINQIIQDKMIKR